MKVSDYMINLEVLNDQQKTWLTQISYLDINDEGRKKINEGGILLKDLEQYLENPNTFFTGDAGLGDKATNKVIDSVLGKNEYVYKKRCFGFFN